MLQCFLCAKYWARPQDAEINMTRYSSKTLGSSRSCCSATQLWPTFRPRCCSMPASPCPHSSPEFLPVPIFPQTMTLCSQPSHPLSLSFAVKCEKPLSPCPTHWHPHGLCKPEISRITEWVSRSLPSIFSLRSLNKCSESRIDKKCRAWWVYIDRRMLRKTAGQSETGWA